MFLRRFTLTFRRFNVTSSLLHNLFKTCRSCGVKVQSLDPKKPGYYQIESRQAKLKPEDQAFNKHFSAMPVETQKLLLNESGSLDKTGHDLKAVSNPTSYTETLKKQKHDLLNQFRDPQESTIECKRCRDVTYRSKAYKPSQVKGKSFAVREEVRATEFPTASLLEVVQQNVPPYSNIVYVVNFSDFPISLNPDIFKLRSAREIKFVITKSDLLFANNSTALKYGTQFVQDYLYRKFRVPAENVMVASGLTNWNMEKLCSFIADDSYIIGNVNSGKSTLLKSMLYYQAKNKKQYVSKRDQLIAEKSQDASINGMPAMNRYAEKKVVKDFEKQFKAKIGPGVSYIPGFTRGVIPVRLSDSKTVYDVAGFVNSDKYNYDYYSMVDNPAAFKEINKGTAVFNKGLYNSEYTTVRSHRVMSFGGLFFIKLPDNAVYQARSCINVGFDIFRDFSSAEKVSTQVDTSYVNFKDRFLIQHTPSSFSKLKRYVVPPHYGTIDIVVQGLGHVNLKPTGAKLTNDPIVIYAVPGLEIIIRQPITDYIAKSFSGRDARGNPLRKENLVEKSTFALKRYTDKQPFYSKLIPTENTGVYDGREEEDHKAIAEFASHGGEDVPYDASVEVNEDNYFKYWVE